MKHKHSATTLLSMALEGTIAACEARAFAAFHAATLDATNHVEYVEAFVLQLGAPAQHPSILDLLARLDRSFRAGKIAYKPVGAQLLTSVLDVARWVGARLDGGLAHAKVLERAQRADVGGVRKSTCAISARASTVAEHAIATLERVQLLVPRAATFELIATRTRLLRDYVVRHTLMGDCEAAERMTRGDAPLLQLFDRGTQDRKELETLVCAALRERGRVLAFTSAEFLLDAELVALVDESDRAEGVRRADAYVIVEEGAITHDAYARCLEARSFFKQAARLDLVVGVSIKSDFGLRNRRTTSGALHADHCALVLFALPCIDERTATMSDVVVFANAHPRFSAASGRICYVGAPLAETTRHTLTNVTQVRCLPTHTKSVPRTQKKTHPT